MNTIKHDITLPRQTVIGTLQSVEACHPIPVPSGEKVTVAQVQDRSPPEPGPDNGQIEWWDPPVEVQRLSQEQQELVQRMLREESAVFTKDDMDLGCIENLRMEITLPDNIPVAKRYNGVQRPLYAEVKSHLQCLLNKNFARK